MMFRSPTVLQAAATAAGTGAAANDPAYPVDGARRTAVALEVKVAGSPTFSLQPEQSLDGFTNVHSVGAAITAPGLYLLKVVLPYFRANLKSITQTANTDSVTVTAVDTGMAALLPADSASA
jgi:hypothetical protein